ncbi:hypothetical protein DPEC_G00107760 [Dallia pectoralis]|uniref:Uncharacterized protein n=1 Tax=Dallia pectoralis TaxID=75939 RepID=A0ACC2GSF3_DALPE|nr:hypothetical protein DPEC_G00107760 [Dallia pectoralis]
MGGALTDFREVGGGGVPHPDAPKEAEWRCIGTDWLLTGADRHWVEVNRTLGKATLAAVPELQKRASDERAQQRSGVRRYGSYQNEDGSTLSATASCKVKAPLFSGDVDFEAFRAQFELLAESAGWGDEEKALQLALCLAGDAVTCLLMLTPEQRRSYRELVAALDRRFGKDKHRELALSALGRRQRMPGKPLRALANDVERLTRRAYGHTPPVVQDELASDRFVLALSPPELRARTQLACPLSLQEALDVARRNEVIWEEAMGRKHSEAAAIRATEACAPREEMPGWARDITELVRALSIPSSPQHVERRNLSGNGPVCWRCGQIGHLRRECTAQIKRQGNDSGSVQRGQYRP